MSTPEQKCFRSADLIQFATALLEFNGLEPEKAQIVAETLVEADLMGHTTHGLRLLPAYLKELGSGLMTARGVPTVVKDFGSAVTWDGNHLPGPWLVHSAINLALERIKDHPVVTVVIRKSHHIACLAAYPEKVARQGFLMTLTCSDPDNKTVAPFGGRTPVLGSNPIAAGIPGETDPVIFDISTSETAGGQIHQVFAKGKKLPHPWIITAEGQLSNDPATFINQPDASILPLGGMVSGYKGTALGLWVESLTNGLSGYGRSKNPGRWCASVFLQLIDPAAFGGKDDFMEEADFLANACREAQPLPGTEMRLPGERAFKLREEQKSTGVRISASLLQYLNNNLLKYNVPFPSSF